MVRAIHGPSLVPHIATQHPVQVACEVNEICIGNSFKHGSEMQASGINASLTVLILVILPRTGFANRIPGFIITRVPGKITDANVAYDVIALQQCCAGFFH